MVNALYGSVEIWLHCVCAALVLYALVYYERHCARSTYHQLRKRFVEFIENIKMLCNGVPDSLICTRNTLNHIILNGYHYAYDNNGKVVKVTKAFVVSFRGNHQILLRTTGGNVLTMRKVYNEAQLKEFERLRRRWLWV